MTIINPWFNEIENVYEDVRRWRMHRSLYRNGDCRWPMRYVVKPRGERLLRDGFTWGDLCMAALSAAFALTIFCATAYGDWIDRLGW